MDPRFESQAEFNAYHTTWSKALDWWLTEYLEPYVTTSREMVLAVDKRLLAVEAYLGWGRQTVGAASGQTAAPKAQSRDQGQKDLEAENRRLSRVVEEQAEAIRSMHLQMEHVQTELEDRVQALQARLNKKKPPAKTFEFNQPKVVPNGKPQAKKPAGVR